VRVTDDAHHDSPAIARAVVGAGVELGQVRTIGQVPDRP
jgi:hypothetical protein